MAPAEPGLLDAAPRRGRLAEREQVVVDRDGARLQLLGEPAGRPARARPARGREAERRSRSRGGCASSSESTTMTGRSGPNVSSHIARIAWSTPVRTVGGNHHPFARGRSPPTRTLRALRDGVLEVLLDEVALAGRRQRTHVGRRRERVAEAKRLRPRDDLRKELRRRRPSRRRRARRSRTSGRRSRTRPRRAPRPSGRGPRPPRRRPRPCRRARGRRPSGSSPRAA